MNLNRLHNVRNPNQGDAHKVLVVCSAGLLRSPTIAAILIKAGYNARAVGCNMEYALIPLDAVLVEWADTIICVELSHFHRIRTEYAIPEDKIICLPVPDNFGYMAPQLVEIATGLLTERGFLPS